MPSNASAEPSIHTGPPLSRRPLPPEATAVSSVHGQVVESLGSRIATGHLTGVLDLDGIAQEFQVSRSLVREALRTLASKGMVQARQRTGTTVTDAAHWSLLDEHVIRWRAAGPRRFKQMEESLQVRLRIEPLAARLMSERQDPESMRRLREAVSGISRAITESDSVSMIAADTAFHRELYLASGNNMLAGLAGTVHACLWVPDFQDHQLFSADTVARHQHLADVLETSDPEAAERTALAMMERSAALFRAAHLRVLDAHR